MTTMSFGIVTHVYVILHIVSMFLIVQFVSIMINVNNIMKRLNHLILILWFVNYSIDTGSFILDAIDVYSDREIIFVIICDRTMLPTFVRLYSKCPKWSHRICMDPIPDSVIRKLKARLESPVLLCLNKALLSEHIYVSAISNEDRPTIQVEHLDFQKVLYPD